MKTIKVKEFEVPVGAMGDVAGIITDNDLVNTITGVDEDGEFVYVEVRYEKGEEEEEEGRFEPKILEGESVMGVSAEVPIK